MRYGTQLAVKKWRPEVSKPLHISLAAVNRGKRKQKIYLTKVTAVVTAFDDQGQTGDARTVADEAGVDPGYIVTPPNSYNQSLTLPAVDSGSSRMTIDLTYELVMEVGRTRDIRDFAKQVATDSVRLPLSN